MNDWKKAYKRLVKHMEKICLIDREKSSAEEDPLNKAWFHGAATSMQAELQIAEIILEDLGLKGGED